MEFFTATLISGIAIGGVYALLVTVLNLVILVRGFFYFGYPSIVVMSMCLGWLVFEVTGDNLVAGILAMILGGVLLTCLTEPILRPLAKRRSLIEAIIVTVGIGIILVDIHSHYINYGASINFPSALAGGGAMFRYGVVAFSMADIYVVATVSIIIFLLLFFLYRNKYGKAMRAVGQSIEATQLIGIPITNIGFLSFVVAGLVGGITAVLFAMSLGYAIPGMGDLFAVRALMVLFVAGAGNLPGGLICSLLLGILESMSLLYLPTEWVNAIVFGSMMMIIILKPNGLFGTRV